MSDPQFLVFIGTLMLIASGCFPSDTPAANSAWIAALCLYIGALIWWIA